MNTRLILLPFVGCLLFTTVAAQRPKRGEKPSAGQETSETAQARLRFVEPTFDFGTIERRGGDLIHEFEFVNEGTSPLVLVRVITSCSCLKAHFSKRPVAPGERGTLRITYEPHKREPGVFNKVIQIYSNSAGGRVVVTVQGNSVDTDRKTKNRN
ncbi:DUF1573 domain-containing protein [Alistipes sp.]|uniref:DUF1573 domain-containing protein n=1 Tax=Alistipes sp. TaxID=1872444 RepID=UPI003AF1AD9D